MCQKKKKKGIKMLMNSLGVPLVQVRDDDMKTTSTQFRIHSSLTQHTLRTNYCTNVKKSRTIFPIQHYAHEAETKAWISAGTWKTSRCSQRLWHISGVTMTSSGQGWTTLQAHSNVQPHYSTLPGIWDTYIMQSKFTDVKISSPIWALSQLV